MTISIHWFHFTSSIVLTIFELTETSLWASVLNICMLRVDLSIYLYIHLYIPIAQWPRGSSCPWPRDIWLICTWPYILHHVTKCMSKDNVIRVVNNPNDIIFLTTHIYMRLSRTACQFLFVVQTGWVVSERGWYLHESIFIYFSFFFKRRFISLSSFT